MNNYLFSFNTGHYDNKVIHSVILQIPELKDWWHYLPNIYIFTADASSKTMADHIMAKLPGLLFFIVKIDLQDTNGVLKKEAWDWINKKNKTPMKLKVVQKPNAIDEAVKSLKGSQLPPIPSTDEAAKALRDILKDFDV